MEIIVLKSNLSGDMLSNHCACTSNSCNYPSHQRRLGQRSDSLRDKTIAICHTIAFTRTCVYDVTPCASVCGEISTAHVTSAPGRKSGSRSRVKSTECEGYKGILGQESWMNETNKKKPSRDRPEGR